MATTELLSGLPLKGLIRDHYQYESLKNLICDKVSHIPNFQALKNSVQLVELICTLVENCIRDGNSKQKKPVDKQQLVIDILDKLFGV
jgi:hypothetical protein